MLPLEKPLLPSPSLQNPPLEAWCSLELRSLFWVLGPCRRVTRSSKVPSSISSYKLSSSLPLHLASFRRPSTGSCLQRPGLACSTLYRTAASPRWLPRWGLSPGSSDNQWVFEIKDILIFILFIFDYGVDYEEACVKVKGQLMVANSSSRTTPTPRRPCLH